MAYSIDVIFSVRIVLKSVATIGYYISKYCLEADKYCNFINCILFIDYMDINYCQNNYSKPSI